jgi:hypothetical protein
MLAFARWTPGILDYYRELVEGRSAQDGSDATPAGAQSPITAPEPEDDGGDLMDEYLSALHGDDNHCAKCGRRLGVATRSGSDGRRRHPECG